MMNEKETRLLKMIKQPLMLVIDMQNIYLKGQKWECVNFEQALDKIKILIDYCISDKVIFTRYIATENQHGVWNDYNIENADVNLDEWSNELVDDLKSLQGKYECFDKSVYSSYSIGKIRDAVAEASCVVVTGVVAECCILSTVMNLIDAGVYVIYLKDAIAGVDEDTEVATIKVLEGLSPLHLSIMTTEEYLEMSLKKL
ncbi:MAG: isochorismatase family protein [Lachnospiraceae bacterium]|nr:isochorismatase family protein [Lachnospiraceae bacterium]